MCILSDGDIGAAVADGALRVEPYEADNRTPNGLDLRVGEVLVKAEQRTVTEGTVEIAPGTWFAMATLETVTLGPQVAAQLWIRSSYARKGMIAVFGKVEAGFSGTLTIPAVNLGPDTLHLPIGDRFCQIVFERLHSIPQALYHERSGNYQGQQGVTLAPIHGDAPRSES